MTNETGTNANWESGHRYVIGVDWASTQDTTAITTIDATTNESEAKMKIKNQKTGRYNQTYIYPFLQEDAPDEETFLKGHIFVVDNEIQINLGLGNYSIDQIKTVRDALDIAIKVAGEGEAE